MWHLCYIRTSSLTTLTPITRLLGPGHGSQHHNKPLVCSDPPEPEQAAANYSPRSARSEMKKTLRRCAIIYLVLANFSCNLTSVKRGSNKDPCFVRCRSSFSCQNYPFKKVRWRRLQLLSENQFLIFLILFQLYESKSRATQSDWSPNQDAKKVMMMIMMMIMIMMIKG